MQERRFEPDPARADEDGYVQMGYIDGDELLLARVERDAEGMISAVDDERPVVPIVRMHTRSLPEDDLGAQVQDDAAVNSQAGRLTPGHKQKHLDGGSDLRRSDRWEDRASKRRSKKATRSRDRRVRSAETLRDTVLAQIRVASGETGASPALVANARKALQPRLDALRAEMPGLTDDEAFEGLRTALAALR